MSILSLHDTASNLISQLKAPGVWVCHQDYSKSEPEEYVRSSLPFEAADILEMQNLKIKQLEEKVLKLETQLWLKNQN